MALDRETGYDIDQDARDADTERLAKEAEDDSREQLHDLYDAWGWQWIVANLLTFEHERRQEIAAPAPEPDPVGLIDDDIPW